VLAAGLDPDVACCAPGGVSALELALRPVRPVLDDPRVTELCINRPGEGLVERTGAATDARTPVALPFASFEWCLRLAKLVAHASRQRIDEESPLLSATLPSGERVQFAIPPACPAGTVAITIRRPSAAIWSNDELAAAGLFPEAGTARADASGTNDERLLELLAADRFVEFVREAVRMRKNIVVSGPTGSGKTTFTKALIREIPTQERLITIEDAAELVLDKHPNHVRLFYSKDSQGLAKVGPRRLLEACLRMRPDRILLAELRGDEAYDYLRNVCSGHPGSITSVHAASCALAFEQLALLVRQNPAGRELPSAELRALLLRLVDVVIQFGIDSGRRVIREVWFDPDARRAGNQGGDR
jgi:type IV secretion system protein VirB11